MGNEWQLTITYYPKRIWVVRQALLLSANKNRPLAR